MINFVTTKDVTPFASMDDVISFKIYAYDVLGLEITCVRYLNEIGFASDEFFGTYHNKITNDDSEYQQGILNAAQLIKGLSQLPADIPDIMKNMQDALVKQAMKVVTTDEDVYLA